MKIHAKPMHLDGSISYWSDRVPEIPEIVSLYGDAGLRRPIDDLSRLNKMYANSNLIISAWSADSLVGIARSVTDFSYCCYLSDLAVKKEFQRQGIGKKLIELTKGVVGPQAMLLLLSAPNAMDYYPPLHFESVKNGFILKRDC